MELTTAKYKNTEMGLIPEDWELIDFGDLVNYTKGYAFKSNQYTNSGTRIIRVSDTTFDDIEDSNAVFISNISASKFSNWKLKTGDLIFSTVGSKPPMYDSLVGKAIFVTEKHKGSLLNQNAVLIRSKKGDVYFQKYLLGHFRTQRYINHIEKIFRGNANQASITLDGLFAFKIPVPNNNVEQKAIAQVLSDTDALIQALEKKIVKKKIIKKGVMQRLFENSKSWNTKKIKDFGFDISDGNYSSKYPKASEFRTNGVPFIRANNIKNMTIDDDDMRFISQELHNELKKGHLKQDDILITNRGDIGQTALVPKKHIGSNINAQVVRINANKKIDKFYLFYFLRLNSTQNLIQNMQTGSALKQLPVNKIFDIDIFYPDPNRQSLIGKTLLDIDAEIINIQDKKEKYEELKQGMMQQLLTGKIRLV